MLKILAQNDTVLNIVELQPSQKCDLVQFADGVTFMVPVREWWELNNPGGTLGKYLALLAQFPTTD